MTMEELSELLTKKVSVIEFSSPHDEEVRYRMFKKITSFFDEPIKILEKNKHNYLILQLGKIPYIEIYFKISIEKTNQTVQISRLKFKDIKKVGSVKFSHLRLCLELPYQGGSIFRYIEMNKKVKNHILGDLLSEENIILESKKSDDYYPNLNIGIKKFRRILQ